MLAFKVGDDNVVVSKSNSSASDFALSQFRTLLRRAQGIVRSQQRSNELNTAVVIIEIERIRCQLYSVARRCNFFGLDLIASKKAAATYVALQVTLINCYRAILEKEGIYPGVAICAVFFFRIIHSAFELIRCCNRYGFKLPCGIWDLIHNAYFRSASNSLSRIKVADLALLKDLSSKSQAVLNVQNMYFSCLLTSQASELCGRYPLHLKSLNVLLCLSALVSTEPAVSKSRWILGCGTDSPFSKFTNDRAQLALAVDSLFESILSIFSQGASLQNF